MASMMLITSTWGKTKTFKLIPSSLDCPYNEVIYDQDTKVLAIIAKEKRQSLHMVPKLDDNGDLKTMKIGKRQNGKDYAESRVILDTYYEYYIEDQEEIKAFVNRLAINTDTFDFLKYMETPQKGPSNLITV